MKVIFVLLCGLLSLLVVSSTVFSATITETKPGVPVSLKIQDTDLLIDGCVAPNSLVTITKDSIVSGTVASDNVGQFSRLFTAQTPTIHVINTFFEDKDNVISTPTNDLIALPVKTLTEKTINPAPTVKHSPSQVESGKTIKFQGYGCPNTIVELLIDNNLSISAPTDENGYWFIELNSINYALGTHVYTVSASGSGGYESSVSQKYSFKVVEAPDSVTPRPPVQTQPRPTSFVPNPSAPTEDDVLDAPVITSPISGTLSSTRQIDVRGTGPINTQIEIFVDGELIGSVFSNAFGGWQFTATLHKQTQSFTARACTGRMCSGLSNTVEIRFVGDIGACTALVKLNQYRFNGLANGKGIDVDIEIPDIGSGYQVITDWGDTTIDHQDQSETTSRLHHTYTDIGHYNGLVSITNNNECIDTVYFSVEVVEPKDLNFALFWSISAVVILFVVLRRRPLSV